MTIQTTTTKSLAQGNGATTVFTYNFQIPTAGLLRVTFINSSGVQTVLSPSLYSATGIGTINGGTVTYPLTGSPIATGTFLLIERFVPLQQTTSLENQAAYFPAVVEGALDNLEMQIQQLAAGALSPLALTFPVVDVSPVTTLPAAAARANKYLSFDSSGNPFMASGSSLPGDISAYSATPTGGSTTRTLASHFFDFVNVLDFGAKCDDSTDDTAAIQAAINSVGDTSVTVRAGPYIYIPGPCLITSTLTIRRKGVVLVGNGWGLRDDSGARRTYLRWGGVAGSSMVKFQDCEGDAGIYRLKLLGSTSANPLAAIEINETNDGVPNHCIFLEQVKVGAFSGETGSGTQFTNGVLFSGTGVNNSEIYSNGLDIGGCSGYGYKQSSVQNVNHTILNSTISSCGTGVRITGSINMIGMNLSSNGVDFEVPQQDDNASFVNSRAEVSDYFSELSGRLALLNGTTSFQISNASFMVGSSSNADGEIVKNDGNISVLFKLINFKWFQSGSPPASPFLSFRSNVSGASERHLIFDGVIGWSALTGGTNGLNVACRGGTDRTYIFFREYAQAASSSAPRVAQNFLTGSDNFDITRFDFAQAPTVAKYTGVTAGGAVALKFGLTGPWLCFGTGLPTLVAPKGSLYLPMDGFDANSRAFVNTDGSTGWTNLVSAA